MALTLSGLRDRVETMLADASNVKWSITELDEAIRQALEQYSMKLPHHEVTTLTLTSAGREVDVSSLAYKRIWRVAFPYDASDVDALPNDVPFELWTTDRLLVFSAEVPAVGQVLRIWYSTAHTLDGLDSTTTTTFWSGHATLLCRGAAAFAVLSRGVEITEMATVGRYADKNLLAWGTERLLMYTKALESIARKHASGVSGIAPVGSLDRWDARGG